MFKGEGHRSDVSLGFTGESDIGKHLRHCGQKSGRELEKL